MAFIPKTDPIWKELSSITSDEGVFLYDLERFGAGGLRVFITAAPESAESSAESTVAPASEEMTGPAPRRNVTSGDCSRLCKRLMTYFTVEGPNFGLSSEPEIEVSSPGVNRNLRLWDHFVGAVGERVRFGLRGEAISEESGEAVQLGGLLGTLEAASDERLRIRDEKTKRAWMIKFNQVARAAVEFEFR